VRNNRERKAGVRNNRERNVTPGSSNLRLKQRGDDEKNLRNFETRDEIILAIYIIPQPADRLSTVVTHTYLWTERPVYP
jgi:hypothetical protein